MLVAVVWPFTVQTRSDDDFFEIKDSPCPPRLNAFPVIPTLCSVPAPGFSRLHVEGGNPVAIVPGEPEKKPSYIAISIRTIEDA